jgi:hypothetical protein
MKPIKLLFITFFCLFTVNSYCQKSNIWITYGQSKFVYSPGIEANYSFNRYIGIQAGVNGYFQIYDTKQIVNITENILFDFYNTNLGLCTHIIYKEKHKLGLTAGLKGYYGPEYDVLHYYKDGGYNIYYDSWDLEFSYGVDIGIFYTYKRFSTILKFDTARNKLRLGIGYALKSWKLS